MSAAGRKLDRTRSLAAVQYRIDDGGTITFDADELAGLRPGHPITKGAVYVWMRAVDGVVCMRRAPRSPSSVVIVSGQLRLIVPKSRKVSR